MSDNQRKIAYIYDEDLKRECDRLPTMLNRASIVQDLINSYGLLNVKRVTVVKSFPASEEELKSFHSSAYIEFLKKTNDCDDLEIFENEQEEFGLGYDCPLLNKNYDFIRIIAGGSLTAAKLLVDYDYKIVVNFFGGWHHSQRDEAEGFCYVNDIVIAIQKLTQKYKRVLYIDLDVHHGNGVENAFALSNKILTLSLHKYNCGFYPGSGSLSDIGFQKGRYYSLNVPFNDGVGDNSYLTTFNSIFPRVYQAFLPSAIVIQCGADVLKDDPLGGCNLTIEAMGECVKSILGKNLPTLLLGGGGYNFYNTARYWTYLMSIVLDQKLANDIPDNCEYFINYAPSYELSIEPGNIKDSNSKECLEHVINTILSYCCCIESSQLQ